MLRNRRILYPKSIIRTWWARELVRREKRQRHILRYTETMVIDVGTIRSFCYCNVCVFTEYSAGGKIEKNEMGGACGAYGAGERGVQGSGGET